MRKSVLCGVLLLLFGKMVSAQQALSLQECRDLAVKNNKELRIAEEKIRMADYEKKAALTKYFPQISANGAYMWNQKDLNLLDMGQLSSSLASSLGGLAQLPVVQQTVGAINDLAVDDDAAAHAPEGEENEQQHAVALVTHQLEVGVVRQEGRQDLGAVQRRDGDQVEDA